MTAIPDADAAGQGRTDAELARASANGDRRAFAEIYDRYANRLHDFCIGMLRDRDLAADCVHDTFCTAATTLASLRDPDKLRPWLYAVARNEALRHLRERRRERPADDLPDAATHDPGPATLAHRKHVAALIAEAAGGLSDRDRTVMELAYRHGMDGPELAVALGVSHTNAGSLVHRLRDTVERCLGALLVSRRVQSDPARCPQLAAILHGWDGQFTALMRKRIARHIDACAACDQERRRLVNPVALLGATPVFLPAPAWLRERTLRDVELTSSVTGIATDAGRPVEAEASATTVDDGKQVNRKLMLLIALMAGIPLAALGLAIGWRYAYYAPAAPVGGTETSTPIPTPAAPLSPTITTASPPSPNLSLRPQPTSQRRDPGTTPTASPPDTGRTSGVSPTVQSSAATPPPAPAPTPPPPTIAESTPPPGEMQVPPATPEPGPPPATTFVPLPNQAPPAETYKPGPFYEPTPDAPR